MLVSRTGVNGVLIRGLAEWLAFQLHLICLADPVTLTGLRG